jgi:hypothetical protein
MKFMKNGILALLLMSSAASADMTIRKAKSFSKAEPDLPDLCPELAISKWQSKYNKYAADAQEFNHEYCINGLEAIGKGKSKKGIDETSQDRTQPPGVLDIDYYTSVAKSFVGLNPISGNGSGFIYRESTATAMDNAASFGNVPSSGGGRNNLCTCACEPSDSGVGCAGHAGINFRYGSLLWTDPITGAWTGQMQALQNVGNATDPVNLNFLGTDTRMFPGGPAVYNVACTQLGCSDQFAGVFRQYNDHVSCEAGLAEAPLSSSCNIRCGDSGDYKEWLAYCSGDTDTSVETGFRGYGV